MKLGQGIAFKIRSISGQNTTVVGNGVCLAVELVLGTDHLLDSHDGVDNIRIFHSDDGKVLDYLITLVAQFVIYHRLNVMVIEQDLPLAHSLLLVLI